MANCRFKLKFNPPYMYIFLHTSELIKMGQTNGRIDSHDANLVLHFLIKLEKWAKSLR